MKAGTSSDASNLADGGLWTAWDYGALAYARWSLISRGLELIFRHAGSALGGSQCRWQCPALMGQGRTGGVCFRDGDVRLSSPPARPCTYFPRRTSRPRKVHTEDAGETASRLGWMLQVGLRQCGVTAAGSVSRHWRPPDGRVTVLRWEDDPSIC